MLHLTGWNNVEVGKKCSTNWDKSHYWIQKLQQKYPLNKEFIDKMNVCKDIPIKSALMDYIIKNQIQPIFENGKRSAELLKEYIFENIRFNEFPEKPSRQRCMFCFSDNKDIEDMRKTFNLLSDYRPNIIQIKPANDCTIHKTDASLLDCNLQEVDFIENNARIYWTGVEQPKKEEILLLGSFVVKKIISKSE